MNPAPEINPNEVDTTTEAWEMRVQQEARNFPYPPTPDIAHHVRGKLRQSPRRSSSRIVRAAVLLLLVLGALILFPPTRAVMIEIIRIGAVRLLPYPPTPTLTMTPAAHGTLTRTPLPASITSILDLPGETTLEAARQQVRFKMHLPSYPAGIGLPDRVFLQHDPIPVVTLVWLDAPDSVHFVLAIIGEEGFIGKFYPWNVQSVQVNGSDAVWLTEPHELYQELPVRNSTLSLRRVVDDFVLAWVDGHETYRLETRLPLEEAIKIAESLQ